MQLSPRQEFKGLFQWMNRATGEIDLPGAVVEKVGPSAGEAGRGGDPHTVQRFPEKNDRRESKISTGN